MAQTQNTVGIRIVTDSNGAVKGIEAVGDSLKKLGGQKDVGKNLDTIAKASTISRLKDLGGIIMGVADKVIGFGQGAIEASAKWVALDSQWSQIWGNIEGEATDAMNKIGKETSILPNRLQPAMTSIAAFAKTAGFDQKGALDLATRATMAAADSAAFYDRSLEDTTESLKSYLKGNYENDAALGISSTETTRNAKANELYGKSFKDLAEDQKQLTLLKMVEDGNKLSGALGQAAREGDGLENVMGNLKQVQEDFMRTLGDLALPTFIKLVQGLTGFIEKLIKQFKDSKPQIDAFGNAVKKTFDGIMKSPAIQWLKMGLKEIGQSWIDLARNTIEGTGKILDVIGGFFSAIQPTFTAISAVWYGWVRTAREVFNVLIPAVFDVLSPILKGFLDFFVDIMNTISNKTWSASGSITDSIINNVVPAIKSVSDWAKNNQETLEKVGELIAGLATAFLAYKSLMFVVSFFQTLGTAFSVISGVLSGLPALFSALGVVIGTISLPVTLIVGAISALVGVIIYLWQTNEGFRDAVMNIWQAIKDFLEPIIQSISDFIVLTWGNVVNWWNGGNNGMMNTVRSVWNSIKEIFSAVLEIISIGVKNTVDKMKAFWDTWGKSITATVQVAWTLVKNTFTGTLEAIWSVVKAVFTQIGNTIDFVMKTIKNVVNIALSFIKGDWDGVLDGIKNLVGDWGDFIKKTFDNVTGTMKDLVSNAIDKVTNIFNDLWNIDLWGAGKAIIDGFVDGLQSAWEKGKDFIGGIGDWIAEHKGPIEYDRVLLVEQGLAIMFGFNRGLQRGFENVKTTVSSMATEIQDTFAKDVDTSIYATGNLAMNSDLATNNVQAQLDRSLGTTSAPITINIDSVDSQERINQLTREISRTMEIQYQGQNQFE